LVSAAVRKGLPTTYVFRNYTMPPGYQSRFAGNVGMKFMYRQAVRASSAAPGVFREAMLDNEIHLDGGTNCNNPTAVAIHECYNLWPGEPIQAG
jgi:predicted patatin/cPLA2 family phospholipase